VRGMTAAVPGCMESASGMAVAILEARVPRFARSATRRGRCLPWNGAASMFGSAHGVDARPVPGSAVLGLWDQGRIT
jgi:hypothetical protein